MKAVTKRARKKTHNELVVYIYNIVEDEWSFISAISDKEERKKEIENSNSSAESYLFANADRKSTRLNSSH